MKRPPSGDCPEAVVGDVVEDEEEDEDTGGQLGLVAHGDQAHESGGDQCVGDLRSRVGM